MAVRTPCFWFAVLAHASIELLWCGTQLFLVELLGAAGLAPAQVATAQAVGSVAAMGATLLAGLMLDAIADAYRKRWVLVVSTAVAGLASLALLTCTRALWRACVATALLGASMGTLDVVYSTLYASLFGRAHLSAILGLVGTVTYCAIAASSMLFGLARHLSGGFAPVLRPLAVWMPLAALALALAPPPMGSMRKG